MNPPDQPTPYADGMGTLKEDLLKLCHMIEAMPASKQQTNVSHLASELYRRCPVTWEQHDHEPDRATRVTFRHAKGDPWPTLVAPTPAAEDTKRINKLDRMLCEDTRFRLELRWDSQNDFLSIVDANGNVWAEVESANDEEGVGDTLRRAIDSITRVPVRKGPEREAESAVGAATPTPDLAPTPRTDAEIHRFRFGPEHSDVDHVFRFARTLERELSAAKAECERLDKGIPMLDAEIACERKINTDLNAELGRLRAEVERLTTALQSCEITLGLNMQRADEAESKSSRYMTEIERLMECRARAEKAEAALVAAVAEASRQVEASDSLYRKTCAEREEQRWLKECSIYRTGEVMAERDALAKDKARFNLLAAMLEDTNIGEIDPTKFVIDDNWPDAWRYAIDAAMKGTPSNGSR